MVRVVNGLRRIRGAALSSAAAAALLVPGLVAVAQTPTSEILVAAPATAAAAPQDTVLFVSVDMNRDSDQWQQAQDLLDRVGAPNALDDAEQMLLHNPENASGGVTQADLDAMFGGEMAIVVTSEAVRNIAALVDAGAEAARAHEAQQDMAATPAIYSEDSPADAMLDLPKLEGYGIVGVLQPSDAAQTWDYVERQMTALADSAGSELQETNYNDSRIHVAPKPMSHHADRDRKHDKKKDSRDYDGMHGDGDWDAIAEQLGTGTIAAARAGDFILVGGSASDLEPFIDAATGAKPSLADLPAMQEVRAAFPHDALMFGYTSAPAVRDALDPEWIEKIDALNQTFVPGADASALWDVSSGGVVWADRPGLRFDEVSLVAGGALPDIYPANAPIDFAKRVSDSTLLYGAGHVTRTQLDAFALSAAQSINQAVKGESGQPQSLADIEDMLTPEYYERQLAEAEQILGFNLKTDFVDHLTGELGIAIGMPQFGMGDFTLDAVTTAGVADKEPVQKALQSVVDTIERNVTDAEIAVEPRDGDTLYRIGDTEGDMALVLLAGVLGNDLVVGTQSGVDTLESGPMQPLADDPQFQTVMGLLPQQRYAESYVNLGPIVDLFVMMSGQGGFTGTGTPEAAPSGGPEAVRAIGAVSWANDGKAGSSAIIYIVGPDA
ncbi:MAG: DUF3352 domain-containing protein [Thermomicrobiales bacterium]|nr:DUF3352 domain-containing protein [Thermomicrobiales bacterium]